MSATCTDFWIGCSSHGIFGTPSQEVRRARLATDGTLTLGIGTDVGPSPMYLAAWRDRVLVVNEHDPATTSMWSPRGERLELVGRPQPNGSTGACYLTASDGDWLVTANYFGGAVCVQALGAGGTSPQVSMLALTGSGPNPDRQEASHPHQVYYDAPRDQILVPDLGSDQVWQLRADRETGTLRILGSIAVTPGSGPRHLDVVGERAYLVGELDGTLTVIDLEASAVIGEPVPTSATDHPPADMSCAAVRSTGGGLVLVSNRGPNTISVFSTDEGRPRLVSETPSGGDHPRDFHISDDEQLVLVANQASDSLDVLTLDTGNGRITGSGVTARTPSPVCVLPSPIPSLPDRS